MSNSPGNEILSHRPLIRHTTVCKCEEGLIISINTEKLLNFSDRVIPRNVFVVLSAVGSTPSDSAIRVVVGIRR